MQNKAGSNILFAIIEIKSKIKVSEIASMTYFALNCLLMLYS